MVRIAEHNIYVLRECTLALIAGIFPIARIGAITSLACGAVLDLEFCRYAGKGQGELSLLRRLWDVLRPSDVLLADNLLSNWTGALCALRWPVERTLAWLHQFRRLRTRYDRRDDLRV
ncbi:MAG: transposase [Verrucomicrobiota bacterium]